MLIHGEHQGGAFCPCSAFIVFTDMDQQSSTSSSRGEQVLKMYATKGWHRTAGRRLDRN